MDDSVGVARNEEEKSVLERGYDLLDEVQKLLVMLRSGRYDLKALESLQQRLAAIARSLPPVNAGDTMNDGAEDPRQREREAEKEMLKAQLAEKNAEMKQIIDAYRRFQQDYGILFSSNDPVHSSMPYKRP